MKKLINFGIILILFGVIQLKTEEFLDQHSNNHDTKTVYLRMPRAASTSLTVKIIDGKIREYNNSLDPKILSQSEIIHKPQGDSKVIFFIYPTSLSRYLQIPTKSRANYNYNAELPDKSGEERLLQALTTTVEYDFDALPETVILPNPLIMLNDLLDLNK